MLRSRRKNFIAVATLLLCVGIAGVVWYVMQPKSAISSAEHKVRALNVASIEKVFRKKTECEEVTISGISGTCGIDYKVAGCGHFMTFNSTEQYAVARFREEAECRRDLRIETSTNFCGCSYLILGCGITKTIDGFDRAICESF